MNEKKYKVKNMTYTEGWNINNCKYWITQPYEKWVETFDLSERPPSGYSMSDKEWVNWITKELIKIVDANSHSRTVQYKYSKKNQAGRRYVVGFGLQNISSKMRPYFYRTKHHEVDISNCFPTITYYLFSNARDGDKKAPLDKLEWYLKNRQQAHLAWGLWDGKGKDRGKIIFNKFLNQDIPDFSNNDCKELRDTIAQIHDRRNQYFLRNKEALNLYRQKKKEGSKNPFASAMFHILERQEEIVRNKMISIITDEDTSNRHDMVLQHDGLFTTYPVTQNHIDEINNWLSNTKRQPLLQVSWKPADMFSLVDCETVKYDDNKIFEIKAEQFWSNKFRITNMSGNGDFGWVVVNTNKATGEKRICSGYKKRDIEEFTRGFGVNWTKEEVEKLFSGEHLERATYTDITWMPYNNLQGNILEDKDCFNLYIPDQCKYLEKPDRKTLAIDLFHKLCFALTPDEWTEHMLIGKIAHMFQMPHKPDQSVFVLKGQEGGVGKDTLMKLLRKVYHITDGKRYGDNVSLSGYLGDKTENQVREQIFIWFNETTGKDGHKYMELIKEATTKDYLDRRAKFEKSIQIQNVVRFFVLSNNHTPLKPDRRICLCQVRTKQEDMVGDEEYRDLYNKVLNDRQQLDSLFSHLIDWKTPDEIVEKYSPENNPNCKVQSFPYDGTFDYKQSPSELQQVNEERCCFPIDKFFIRLERDPISDWVPRINGEGSGEVSKKGEMRHLTIQKKQLINLLKRYIMGEWKTEKQCQINPLDEGTGELEEDFSILQNKPDLYGKCKDWLAKWCVEYHDQFTGKKSYKGNDGKRVFGCMEINLTSLSKTYLRQGKIIL